MHRRRSLPAVLLRGARAAGAALLCIAAPAGLTAQGTSATPGVRYAAAQTTGAERRPIAVKDMFSVQRLGSPQVSPDGAWIAYTVSHTSLEDEKSYTRVWMVASAGGDAVPLTAEKKSASSPDWSPDGKYISFLASRDSGKTQVWVLDRRGGEAWPLTDVTQGVSGYEWSPDGTRLLLTIRDADPKDDPDAKHDAKKNAPKDPWVIDRLQFKRDNVGYLTGDLHTHLYVFDVATRALRQITTGRWDEGQATWSPDGTRIAFSSTRTEDPDADPNSEIWLVEATLTDPTDAPTRVTDNPGADGEPAWSPDGRSIAYVTTTDVKAIWYATSYVAVVDVPAGRGTATESGAPAPRILTKALDRNPSGPRFSEDGRWIWFGLEDSAENHVVRIHPDGSGLERPVAGPISAGGFDWAGGTFAVQVGTLDMPSEIWRVDGLGAKPSDAAAGAGQRDGAEGDPRSAAAAATGTAKLARVTHTNDTWMSEVAIGATRNIHYTSEQGTTVEGFVCFPPGYDPDGPARQKLPVLLRIHGGPVSQFSHSFNFEAQLFAADGYVVVYTNPRGSSGYGQAFSQAIFADWGNKDFHDVMAGVDYVLAQGWGDADHMGVGGWSYGGILTDFVITQTHRFKGAISGASEVLLIANYGHDHYQWYWEHELGLPWEGDNRQKVWERISPFNKAQFIETPTLVMGGENDWNVPIQNGEQLYQVLRRRGVPTELVVYPGQGHGIAVPSYQKDRYDRYLAWYGKWVKGESKPVM